MGEIDLIEQQVIVRAALLLTSTEFLRRDREERRGARAMMSRNDDRWTMKLT